MSWSVSAVGKAPAVKVEIVKQFTNSSKCMEPEESVRQAAWKMIEAALDAQDRTFAVKVVASGSQSCKDWEKKTGFSNSLSISIEPLYSFVE